MKMEIRPNPKTKGLYTLINFVVFLLYCPIPVLVLQILKRHPRHLYDIWSLVIALFGVVLFILLQVYLMVYLRTVRYELASEDVREESGVFWKRKKVVPYHKITNLNTLQGPFERLFGLGHLNIQTAGHGANTSPEAKLVGLVEFETAKQEIMHKVRLVKSDAATRDDVPREATQRELLKDVLEVLRRIERNTEKS
jgi:membrane protein YdbS with pleckstrin-like domain